jgi:hypothetical protein
MHVAKSRIYVHHSKSFMGFCGFLEDPRGILCIFGSSSYHFVHLWKFLMGFCTFLEFTPPGSSKNAQNPMRNFQKGTKSNKERFSFANPQLTWSN